MKWIVLVLALALAGCEVPPGVENKKTDNQHYNVTELFNIDGCRVYRFYDVGERKYFVNCGKTVGTSSRDFCGKNCYRTNEIPTTTGGE